MSFDRRHAIPASEPYIGKVKLLAEERTTSRNGAPYFLKEGDIYEIVGYAPCHCHFSEQDGKLCAGRVMFKGIEDKFCMSYNQERGYKKALSLKEDVRRGSGRMIRID